MENWILKPFNALSTHELYEILALRINVFVVEQNCPYPELDWQDQDAYHLWHEEEGKIIMYCRIFLDKNTGKGKIGRVIVQKDHRRKGLGKMLMAKAIAFLQEEKAREIKLAAQANLCTYYGTFGFIQVSEMYLWDDIPHIDMIKPL